MKKPDECAYACCKAVFCWAAKCCCSALSLNSFILDLESEMLAPGVFIDWLVWMSRLFSLSSSARMATRALFWKAGALAAISITIDTQNPKINEDVFLNCPSSQWCLSFTATKNTLTEMVYDSVCISTLKTNDYIQFKTVYNKTENIERLD